MSISVYQDLSSIDDDILLYLYIFSTFLPFKIITLINLYYCLKLEVHALVDCTIQSCSKILKLILIVIFNQKFFNSFKLINIY